MAKKNKQKKAVSKAASENDTIENTQEASEAPGSPAEAAASETASIGDDGEGTAPATREDDEGGVDHHDSNVSGKEAENGRIANGSKAGASDDKVKELEKKIQELTLQLQEKESEEHVKETKVDNEEVDKLKEQLQSTEEERDKFQVQYEALLSRLGSMKSVFSKMKENQTELEETKEQLEEYEKQNMQLKKKLESVTKESAELQAMVKVLKEESDSLNSECDRLSAELRSLRSEFEDKESSWESEKKQLVLSNNKLEKEIEKLRESNEEYLVTLENDKIVNYSLNEEITGLTDKIKDLQSTISQLESDNEHYKQLNFTLDDDLKKLQKTHEASVTKHLESFQALEQELASQRTQFATLQAENAKLQEENTKVAKLEQEVKEKQLQIGKVRHEAVILNEHLTKALQLIKRSSDAETVDKELVSNLFISFLSFPRGDTKKFEVLQLISNYLNWDEDKKIQAGLSHNASASRSKQARESFVSLWTEYLENESVKK